MNPKMSNEYWMSITNKIGEASTCRVNIGCLILQNNVIVGVGYVGSISGDTHCCDNGCLLVNNHNEYGTSNTGKSCIRTIHAEMNAILKCTARGSKNNWLVSYSSYQPCLNCLKGLLSIGVRTIYYEKPSKDINRDIFINNLHNDILQALKINQIGG